VQHLGGFAGVDGEQYVCAVSVEWAVRYTPTETAKAGRKKKMCVNSSAESQSCSSNLSWSFAPVL